MTVYKSLLVIIYTTHVFLFWQLLSLSRMEVVRYEEKLKTYSFVDRSWDSAQQLYYHIHSEMHTLYDVSSWIDKLQL